MRMAVWCLLGLAAAGCGRAPHAAADEADIRRLIVLEPWVAGTYTQSVSRLIDAAFPGVRREPGARFDRVFPEALAQSSIVLLPAARSLPAEVWRPLQEFMDAGGCAVIWDADPFADRVWSSPGGLETERELAGRLAAHADPGPWPSVQSWALSTEPPATGDVARAAGEPLPPWPAVEALIESDAPWSGLVATCPPTSARAGDALVFYARGDLRTGQVIVEAEADDGSRWSAPCRIEATWQPLLVPWCDLQPVAPAAGSVVGRRVCGLRIGVDGRAPDQPGAPHRLGVSDVRLVRDPRTALPPAPEWVGRDAAHAPFLLDGRFQLQGAGGKPDAGLACRSRVLPLDALVPGGGSGHAIRCTPVGLVAKGEGDGVGACAVVQAEWPNSGPVRRQGWLGLEPGQVADQDAVRALRAVVARLQTSHWLLDAGVGRAALRVGDPLQIRYRYEGPLLGAANAVRISAELIDEDERVLRRVAEEPVTGRVATLEVGRAPDAPSGRLDLTLRLRVLETLSTVIRDEVLLPITIFTTASPSPRPPPVAAGAQFNEGGRPLFPLGLAWDDPRLPPRALDPARYPVALIARHLDRMREVGLNTIAVTLDDPAQLPQFEHLAAEAENRRMYILLRMPIFPLLHTDWDAARTLLGALSKMDTRALFAIDVASPEPDAAGWAQAAQDWQREQAPAAVFPLSDLPAQQAALRRMNRRMRVDCSSRHLAAVRALLQVNGFPQAVCRSVSADGESDDPAAGAALQDFLAPSLSTLKSEEVLRRDAFAVAWMRGRSGGRPVVLMEQGPAVPSRAGDAALADQADRWMHLLDLAQGSFAAGVCFAATDDGRLPIFRSDGSWRPVADRLRAFAHQLRGRPPALLPAWRDRRVDLWSEAEGFAGLRAVWGPQFAAELGRDTWQELRPEGFGIETRRLAPTPLSTDASSNLWRELNAVWADAKVNGKPVWRAPGAPLHVVRRDHLQLAICNSGTATWSPWTPQQEGDRNVRVEVRSADGPRMILRVPRLTMGATGLVEWTPNDIGAYELRASMPATGSWGEPLHVVVDDQPNSE